MLEVADLKRVYRYLFAIFGLILILITLAGCSQPAKTDYGDANNWAYLETDTQGKVADVFFICPTVYGGTNEAGNMSLSDAETKAAFLGATNMEKGIYDKDSRFFAPYYRQAGLYAYTLSPEDGEKYLDLAYEDIQSAFSYYLKYYNDGRPIVLAGFSQGADLCLRLLKDQFVDADVHHLLVACYAIGWSITQEELTDYPHLTFATGEEDIGVIISFNSEAEDVQDSLIVPAGSRTLAINPLNWKTDSTPADKSLNLGACFTDYSGTITEEIPALTGAYIDETRGTLKVTDVTPEAYPPGLDIFTEGIYHLYDYQFFYRNLQQNVETRINAYLEQNV